MLILLLQYAALYPETSSDNVLRLGNIVPDFEAETTVSKRALEIRFLSCQPEIASQTLCAKDKLLRVHEPSRSTLQCSLSLLHSFQSSM